MPDHDAVRHDCDAYDKLEPAQRAGFEEYFVVRTPDTARRYRNYVAPGTTLVDEAALGHLFAGWSVQVGSSSFSAPTLVVAGRRDSVVLEVLSLEGRESGKTSLVQRSSAESLRFGEPN